jgi:glycosyltransferase involved in cell wall biosynthesis
VDSRKPLRVLHYSSWKVPCGIADYTEDLLQGLAANGVVNEMVPNDFSQNRSMSYADLHRQQDDLIRRATDFDVVHVQHEYSFFGRTVAESNPEFTRFLDQFLKQTNKPMLVTFHENPPPLPPAQTDFGIKSRLKRAVKGALHFALDLVSKPRERQNGDYGKVFTAHRDRLCALVHTGATRQLVVGQGLPDDRVLVIPMGVKVRSSRVNMDQAEARRLLGLPTDCKLVSQFGFITARKGPHIAALALKQLPPEYRLVFIGGLHPLSYEGILGEIFKIWEGEDPNRIHITDHLPTEEVDVWQAASDVCLAPYLDAHSGSAGITWSSPARRPPSAS